MSNKTNVNMQVVDFFNKEISEQEFAQIIRRTTYLLNKFYVDDEHKAHTDWVRDSNHHLTEFAELLDPQLYKE
jgi:Ulp1 family protease